MSKVNYSDFVRQAKAELLAAGLNPDADDCARFAVVNLAALRISQSGDPDVGVLYKPTGTNCRERATDILCWRDGTIVDCLGAGPDGPNTVLWQENANKVDPSRWRAPFPVGPDLPTGSDGPQPGAVLEAKPDQEVIGRLDKLEGAIADLAQQQALLSNQLTQWVGELKVALRNVPWPAYQGTSKIGKVHLDPVPPAKVG